jgi:hypothetical protein
MSGQVGPRAGMFDSSCDSGGRYRGDPIKENGMTKRAKTKGISNGRLRFISEDDDLVLYCEIKQGRRFVPIAKRYSGKNWINLEPGFVVRGSEPGASNDTIEIQYIPINAGVQ